MKFRIALSLFVASLLALTSLTAVSGQGHGGGAGDRVQQMDRDRDFDRDRDMDRDRDRIHDQMSGDADQDRLQQRDRDRLHVQDPASLADEDIYGNELMTAEEMNQYRYRLQNLKTEEERLQYMAQHEKQMQQRAREQGRDLVPPGQGAIFGGELMTVQERNQYREQLRQIGTEEERLQFMAQHREKMHERAKALELDVEEAE